MEPLRTIIPVDIYTELRIAAEILTPLWVNMDFERDGG